MENAEEEDENVDKKRGGHEEGFVHPEYLDDDWE